MSSANALQILLRFLSQDAKVPLGTAMSKVKDLQSVHLNSPNEIAKSDIKALQAIFEDEKLSKQILNAAKRVVKKRVASNGDEALHPPVKRRATEAFGEPLTGAELEESLELPTVCLDEDILKKTVLFANRAPLVLAFAVVLLKYTMPEQPLSSRLSLAQAVVSTNSRTKAVSIGLESGKSAEEEGYGEGQPTVTVMGREIRVMKRWGYEWRRDEVKEKTEDGYEVETQSTLRSERTLTHEDMPALWGIDLEALKKSNEKNPAVPKTYITGNIPIYTAQSARAYLLKSFGTPEKEQQDSKTSKKQSSASKMAQKERNLGYLLGALQLLFESWSKSLSPTELDKRAWSWYVRVRPEVEGGVAGWGSKNTLKLSDILLLRH
ncbi:hypothetical protein EJ05DRAFT_508441 [Pseudovirgaria hyperparasitica]|uniref:Impact N-terminal domain-containing protein n=1 Tax=Pseudovirgaria hyperparasitica TaxID=470096 RepID=A0A6A6WEW7_9PEZI|nr:uncharacterized protein EJ05DRAFT_508441 [Pseudovirgaria hyperparasitica]KAF2761263.1 hypothetical protein EJ05DRAFT_508441 [Pseudovirgaria hyperparasitica]